MSPTLLAVAACAGARCRALRSLRHGDAALPIELRRAVADRPDAALISTGCLGACHLACVVAVGPALYSGTGRLTWTAPPSTVALADRAERAAALVEWIGGSAPEEIPAALCRRAS